MTILSLIEKLRQRSDLTVEDLAEAWLVLIPKKQEFLCELLIPRNRFEWFASVKKPGDQKEIWSDWMDYYDSPAPQLEDEMSGDILAFVDRLLASDFQFPIRIHEGN